MTLENLTNNTQDKEEYYPWPDEVYLTYIGLIFLSCLINLTISIVLLVSKRNGVISLILQLATVDTFSSFVGSLEIWSLKEKTWPFLPEICPVFSGGEILLNTLLIYLIILLNFHVISTLNLQRCQLQKNNRNPLTKNAIDSSNECLVTKSEKRKTLTSYTNAKNEISLFVPSVLLWFVSISICIPHFTLTSTINLQNTTLCTVVDTYYNQMLQKMLLVFRVLIPEPLLVISGLFLSFKLIKMSSKQHLDNKLMESNKILVKFALILTLFYVILSSQRDAFYFNHTILGSQKNGSIDAFKTPPLFNSYVKGGTNVILAILHYTGLILRPVLYFLLPTFRSVIFSGLYFRNRCDRK